MPEAEKPGALVPWWGILLSLLWLVLLSVVCLYALTALWPHPTPSGALPTEATKTSTAATDTAKSDTTKADTKASIAALCAPRPNDPECQCLTRAAELRALYVADNPKADRNDPSCVHFIFFGWQVVWGETRLLLIVMLCGFLGSLIYSLRSFFWYTGNRNLVISWLALYALTPIVGAMLAVVFYLVLRGGLFSSATTLSDTSPFGFAAVAALVGMFTNQAAEKLRTVFETLMMKAQTGKDPASRTAPVLATVVPSNVPHAQNAALTLTGDHFYADSKVYADDNELTTAFKGEKLLEATLPAALIPNPVDVAVTVVTPNAGKSAAVKLKVT